MSASLESSASSASSASLCFSVWAGQGQELLGQAGFEESPRIKINFQKYIFGLVSLLSKKANSSSNEPTLPPIYLDISTDRGSA